MLPGLEHTLVGTVRQDGGKNAFRQTNLAVAGALQVVAKAAMAQVYEVRTATNAYADAQSHRLAAKVAYLKGVREKLPEEKLAELRFKVELTELEAEISKEKLTQLRRSSSTVAAMLALSTRGAKVTNDAELGKSLSKLSIEGTDAAFESHFDAAPPSGDDEIH